MIFRIAPDLKSTFQGYCSSRETLESKNVLFYTVEDFSRSSKYLE